MSGEKCEFKVYRVKSACIPVMWRNFPCNFLGFDCGSSDLNTACWFPWPLEGYFGGAAAAHAENNSRPPVKRTMMSQRC